MLILLRHLSWPELRHHPWRNAAALVAVILGVALAFSVHLINASALAEFGAAVRSVNGDPDLSIAGPKTGFDETLYDALATRPEVVGASPVVEGDVVVRASAAGAPLTVHLLGLDVFAAAPHAPALLPQLAAGEDRLAVVDPQAIFLNAAAEQGLHVTGGATLSVESEARQTTLRVAGRVATAGPPLGLVDIAGAQAMLGSIGRLSRIDLRLASGTDVKRFAAGLRLPPGVRAALPNESSERLANISRAYRVNLTVLALVAMFTGAFLVFSILALSVAKRQQQFALLGVLGLAAAQRRRLVLAESALLGIVGSALGLALGTALAELALRLFGGDLGGGYFPGLRPALRFDLLGAFVYGGLGVVAALVGGWLPARAAEQLTPARALKGLGDAPSRGRPLALGIVLLLGGVGLALLPPIAGLPLAAYVAVACLLIGGIVCIPGLLGAALAGVGESQRPLLLLAIERARHDRNSATIAVAGVVASLALSIALTIMVASFRDAVTAWLDVVLPADLYLRSAGNAGGERPALPAALPEAAARLPGVSRVQAQRVATVELDPTRPPIALIARPIGDPTRSLPLTGDVVPVPAGAVPIYVSEAVVALYGAKVGGAFALLLPNGRRVPTLVAGVWRDYARQYGAIVIDADAYRRLSGDATVNDLALWLAPGADASAVEAALRRAAGSAGPGLELASPRAIRALSLRIFDRSFAVTYWLQAVAIGIGLFGIAASFSAQVLARRREFGLLVHLGLTRRQILAVVAGEGAVWTSAGAALGAALGIAVSVVLVEVVNPQSFHWTMPLHLPARRLAMLVGAVVVAGTVTATLAAQRAAGRHTVLAVKEDW